jgi:hypothetical protein
MKAILLLKKAWNEYWRRVRTPLTKEQDAERQIYTF